MKTIVICGDDAALRLVARGSFAGELSHVVDVSPRDLPQVLVAFRVHVLVVLGDAVHPPPFAPVVELDVLHVRARDAHRASKIVNASRD
jgi:hypothetical protein